MWKKIPILLICLVLASCGKENGGRKADEGRLGILQASKWCNYENGTWCMTFKADGTWLWDLGSGDIKDPKHTYSMDGRAVSHKMIYLCDNNVCEYHDQTCELSEDNSMLTCGALIARPAAI